MICRVRVSTTCQDVSAFLVVSGGALFSSIVDLLVVLGFQNLDDVVEIEVLESPVEVR